MIYELSFCCSGYSFCEASPDLAIYISVAVHTPLKILHFWNIFYIYNGVEDGVFPLIENRDECYFILDPDNGIIISSSL